MGADGPLYAFSLFLPSIINSLGMCHDVTDEDCIHSSHFAGYTATPANLLSVPVYVVACIVTCVVGWAADRYGNRGYLTM